jgi:hypothetical protein
MPSPSRSSEPDETIANTGSVTGTFIGLEWGDYLHVGVRTADGGEIWFWVLGDCSTDPESLTAGQKIEVSWENRDVYIEEAEETINMDVVTGFRVLSD